MMFEARDVYNEQQSHSLFYTVIQLNDMVVRKEHSLSLELLVVV